MTGSPLPGSAGTIHRDHPDAAFITRAQQALAWWASHAPSTPTSSITGGGAVAAMEKAVSRLVAGQPTLALPNATYALRTALLAVGVAPGDDVFVSGLDWPAGRAAVRSIGASPVPLAVDPHTLTADPTAAMERSTATTAVLVTHLHGVCVDVPALRAAVGEGIPIIEDAAQAFTATLDGRPAGSLADVSVFSFGPGKLIDAGELAVLTTRDETLLDRAIQESQHPARQRLRCAGHAPRENLGGRPCPFAAVVAAYELHRLPERADRLRRADRQLCEFLDTLGPGLVRLTDTARRTGQPGTTTVLLRDAVAAEAVDARLHLPDRLCDSRSFTVATSGATACPGLPVTEARRARSLARRIRLLVFDEPDMPASEESGGTHRPD